MRNFLNQSIPNTINELEEQIKQIDEWRSLCSRLIREFMEKENPAGKIFFPEQIHALTQERNMLQTHREFRRVRIARLKAEEQGYL